MPSANDISSQIVGSLYVSDPDLDTTIGTPLRKIIDAVSTQLSEMTSDNYLQQYQLDVDSMTSGALDDFVANYSMARLQAQRATGVVTFSRTADIALISSVTLPVGTQVTTLTVPPIYAQTTVTATIDPKVLSVDVPVQASVGGTQGNVAAGSLVSLTTVLAGVTAVNNANPMTGGTDVETDPQLIDRFKNSAFRNMAGTDAMYRGIALQTLANPADLSSTAVTQCNILGSTKHQTEQIQIVSGTGTSSLGVSYSLGGGSAYSYGNTVLLTNPVTGVTLNKVGNYNVVVNNSVTPATLTINAVDSTLLPDGTYQLEYDYVPTASRNDPAGSRWSSTSTPINNRVDLWVNGITQAQATQTAYFLTANTFNSTAHDPLLASRYKMLIRNAAPAAGDTFVPLAFGPIISILVTTTVGGNTVTNPMAKGATFTINGNPYIFGTDFDIVHQDDAFGYTPSSQFGLVFRTSLGGAFGAGHAIPNKTAFSLNYAYNKVPSLVSRNLYAWRMLGTDTQVHAGRPVWLLLNFDVVYNSSVSISTANISLVNALASFISRLGFDSALQISDIHNVAAGVAGVDNIRLTNSADTSNWTTAGDFVPNSAIVLPPTPTFGYTPSGRTDANTYGIQQLNGATGDYVTSFTTTSGGLTVPQDIYFDDDSTYPLLYGANFSPKARNTFKVI